MTKYTIRVCQGKKSKNFTIHSSFPLEVVFNALKMGGNKTLGLYEQNMPPELELSVILSYQNGSWVPQLKRIGCNGGEGA